MFRVCGGRVSAGGRAYLFFMRVSIFRHAVIREGLDAGGLGV